MRFPECLAEVPRWLPDIHRNRKRLSTLCGEAIHSPFPSLSKLEDRPCLLLLDLTSVCKRPVVDESPAHSLSNVSNSDGPFTRISTPVDGWLMRGSWSVVINHFPSY